MNGIFFYNGRGTIIFRDGNKYSGEWSNGKIHGRGVYEWVKDKVKYDGEYKFGVKDGVGRYYLTSKKYMTGRWIKGKKEGNF